MNKNNENILHFKSLPFLNSLQNEKYYNIITKFSSKNKIKTKIFFKFLSFPQFSPKTKNPTTILLLTKWNRFRGFILTQRNLNNDNNRISRTKARVLLFSRCSSSKTRPFGSVHGSQAATMPAALATDSDHLDWPTRLIFSSFHAIHATNPIPR